MPSSFLHQAAFTSFPASTFLVSSPPDATILEVNDAGLALSLRERKDVIGRSIFDVFPSDPDDTTNAAQLALLDSLTRAAHSGQACTLEAQRYPIPAALPTGGVAFQERFWSIAVTPLYGGDGNMLCIVLSSTDVTAQLESKRAQDESEARLRALTVASTDVVYRMSPDWTQMWQLEGRGFLKNTADPSRRWLHDYIPPEDQELVHGAIETAIAAKAVFELEHRVLRVDGSDGWTLSRAVPMLDASGNIYEWVGAASDITERKRREETLQQSDRRKDEFLAVLAHELRNPLAPIIAAADLLRLVGADETRVRQIGEIIGRQVVHMSNLVDDLLDVARVAQGAVELDNAPLDVSPIITDAVEQVAPLIRSRGHALKIDVAPEPMLVMGDKKRLVQVVANLVNNAAKYTQEGGNILVKAEVREPDVVVEVVDDGIGMTPDMAARAFDLFAQAERTPDRSSGGLGLGLPLVKKLVELHGGRASCSSSGLDAGSTFAVSLPRLHAQAAGAAPRTAGALEDVATTPLRILVVDDDVETASMTAMLLEASGHEVLVEHEAHRALELAEALAPHVCLLDMGLRDMEGQELAHRLRAQAATSRSLLIALTGYTRESNRKEGSLSAFDRHLEKPVDTRVLTRMLAELRRA